MWKVDGAYAFHAVECGAVGVTGVDLMAETPDFAARNAASGGRVRYVHGDVNDPELPARTGQFDVVFCSGVLYHVPDPVWTLVQLRRLCRQTLILTTASVMELDAPQAAVFLPHMSADERARFDYYVPHATRFGPASPFVADKGYSNWYWLPTPSCVRAMLQVAGFVVVQCHAHRRVTTIVATATEAVSSASPTTAAPGSS